MTVCPECDRELYLPKDWTGTVCRCGQVVMWGDTGRVEGRGNVINNTGNFAK
jgi:hypothetical protein